MFEGVENTWSCTDGFRVPGASKEAIGLKLLERVEPLLSVIIEHVFGVYDGNIEVLQISVNGKHYSKLILPKFWINYADSAVLAYMQAHGRRERTGTDVHRPRWEGGCSECRREKN
jgi:hypothetical protein